MLPQLDQLFTVGLLALFGAIIGGLALGAVVARFTRFETGVAVGMLCLALGGLGTAGRLGWFFVRESAVVEAVRVDCIEEKSDDEAARPARREVFSAGALQFAVSGAGGECEPGSERHDPQRLRYALAEGAPVGGEVRAMAEPDGRLPLMQVGFFAAFGAFGLLGGLVFVGAARRERAQARGVVDRAAERPLGPRRERLATGFTIAGNLTVFAAALLAAFGRLSVERATFVMFCGAAFACLDFAVAFWLRRRLTLETGAILLLVGGGMAVAAAVMRWIA